MTCVWKEEASPHPGTPGAMTRSPEENRNDVPGSEMMPAMSMPNTSNYGVSRSQNTAGLEAGFSSPCGNPGIKKFPRILFQSR